MAEPPPTYSAQVNRRNRDQLAAALRARLRQNGQPMNEADEMYLDRFSRRWSSEEVAIVESWLYGRSAPTF